MDATWKRSLWQQFGAAIDMLENAIRACPEALWGDRTRHPEYWYLAYHTLFWLDFYLSETPQGFAPPAPFTMDETDPAGLLPERVCEKELLLGYLEHGRTRCRATIAALTDERASRRSGFERLGLTVGELHLYNMRHVQHHAAQLNLILRQTIDAAPKWVRRTAVDLEGEHETR